MHLRDGGDDVLDDDGVELPDLEAVKSATLIVARDIMAGDLRNGEIDLRFQIDVENEAGAVVYSLPFEEAVRVTRA